MRKISERGIEIHNARGVYSIPMAEWAIFRVLEHYKQGWFFRKEQTSGTWGKNRNLREIYGSKVAIIGAGNVGQEVAKRFACMGCNVSGFDIHVNPTPFFDNMYLTTTLQEHISEFNIVVVTAPLLPSTKGLVSRAVLEKLKLNATLINIARGGLIDEPAMCEILAQREDLFAALDVFECEPLPEDSKLWHLPNIAISPHNSFVSNGNNERLFSIIYTNIKNFLNNTK
jgi:phosphoglycerate dehydrogenase-like enzyme